MQGTCIKNAAPILIPSSSPILSAKLSLTHYAFRFSVIMRNVLLLKSSSSVVLLLSTAVQSSFEIRVTDMLNHLQLVEFHANIFNLSRSSYRGAYIPSIGFSSDFSHLIRESLTAFSLFSRFSDGKHSVLKIFTSIEHQPPSSIKSITSINQKLFEIF